MSVLILGAEGQVGRHLSSQIPHAIAWGRAEADLTDMKSVGAKISEVRPEVIVNAAAYTAVDQAESDAENAWTVNAAAPAALAVVANALNALLVHYSTDYVFDGSSPAPYKDDDPVRPLNVYGQTKLAGELSLRAMCRRYYILRVGWVFSEFGSNFVKTMVRLARERDTLQVVFDQRGTPTWAGDIASATAQLLHSARSDEHRLPAGTYHLPGGPVTSWYGFAGEIISLAAADGMLDKVPSLTSIAGEDYPHVAHRPANSELALSQRLAGILTERPDWPRGLQATLNRLRSSGSGPARA